MNVQCLWDGSDPDVPQVYLKADLLDTTNVIRVKTLHAATTYSALPVHIDFIDPDFDFKATMASDS